MTKIISDVDGIWLNFIAHFYSHFNEKVPVFTEWDTPFVNDNFHKIRTNKNFWSNLPALSHACEVPEGFQITAYLSSFPHEMLERRKLNMKMTGAPKAPVYQSYDKVSWLKERYDEWDVFIDDKPEEVNACRKAFPDKHIIRFEPSYAVFAIQETNDITYRFKTRKLSRISNFNQLILK